MKHQRRSSRLKNYDYSSAGHYFITLCTQDRLHIFGKIKNGKMILNPFGEIAREEWIKSLEIRKNISLGDFIIMPDHLHGIIKINYKSGSNQERIGKFISPSHTIGAIIRGFKGSTTKRIREIIREGEIINKGPYRTGEWLFAPSKKIPNSSISGTGEWLFAPSEKELKEILRKIPKKGSIWQRNYYESIIRDQKAYHKISKYIINNPLKWEEDSLK